MPKFRPVLSVRLEDISEKQVPVELKLIVNTWRPIQLFSVLFYSKKMAGNDKNKSFHCPVNSNLIRIIGWSLHQDWIEIRLNHKLFQTFLSSLGHLAHPFGPDFVMVIGCIFPTTQHNTMQFKWLKNYGRAHKVTKEF